MFERADGYRPAYADFVRALKSDPRDARALDGLLKTATPAEKVNETRTLLSRLASDPANDPAKLIPRIGRSAGSVSEPKMTR